MTDDKSTLRSHIGCANTTHTSYVTYRTYRTYMTYTTHVTCRSPSDLCGCAGAHPYLEQRRFRFGNDTLMTQQMIRDYVVQFLDSIEQFTDERDELIAPYNLFGIFSLRDEKCIPIEAANLLNNSLQIRQTRFGIGGSGRKRGSKEFRAMLEAEHNRTRHLGILPQKPKH